MKKKVAAILAVFLLLTACSAQKKPEPQTEPEQEQVTEQAPEQEVDEVPMEINPEQTGDEMLPELKTEEGLIEDTVGYVFQYPVFSEFDGAEAINGVYKQLTDGLVAYAKETIYSTASKKNCIASAYSTVEHASENDGVLEVEFKFWVEYSDGTTDENTRTDRFDMTTGELIQED